VSGLGSLSNIAYSLQIRAAEYFLWDALVDEQVALHDNLAQELSDVWAWLFFALNTTMTLSIIYKVLYVRFFISDMLSEITRSPVARQPTVRRPCAKITTSITP
jgi:hypothetical protein